MVDFASKLLKTEGAGESQKVDFASKLFQAHSIHKKEKQYISNPHMQDTDEISTITGKPIQKPVTTGWYQPADFETLVKAGFTDSNEAKFKLFADARGISKDRYSVKDGRVWFKGDDGKYYPETPKEISSLLKKLTAELPSEGLADAGAAVGAFFGGPGGAMAGAAGGELTRKEIGRLFFGDKQKASDYAVDMGVQALLGGVDAKLSKALAAKLSSRKIKKQTGGKISDDFTRIVGDLSPEQRAEGKLIKAKGEKIGVDVLPHQAMDDPTLTGYYKLLRDNPKTARQVRLNDDKLDAQVQKAGEDLIRSISNRETDPFEVGQELSDAGNAAIERMKNIRGDAVKPLYDEANKVTNVDTTPALEEIARLKKKVKPGMKAHSALNRIEQMLTKSRDKIKGAVIIVDGQKISGPTHSEAIHEAIKRGLVIKDADGDLISKGGEDLARSGAIDLFETEKGVILDRFEALKLNGIAGAEDLAKQKTDKIPESNLEIIDNVKQEIDAILSSNDSSAITNKMKRKMMGVKESLTTQTDKVSREYQVGRALFAAASPKITKAEKGILGTLARMQVDEQKENAVKKVFSSARSIRVAKKAVEKVNPELWPDVVAELFRSEFEKASKIAQGAGGKVLNRPGKYTSRMWDLSSRKKIKIATQGMKDGNGDPLYDRIVDFFDVMQKASIGQGKESATQPRLKMEKDLQGISGKFPEAVSNLKRSITEFGLSQIGVNKDQAFDKNAKKLLNLMQTPEGVDLIAKAKGYGANTEKGMIAATTLLLMATETNAEKVNEIIQTYRGR